MLPEESTSPRHFFTAYDIGEYELHGLHLLQHLLVHRGLPLSVTVAKQAKAAGSGLVVGVGVLGVLLGLEVRVDLRG